MRGRGLRDGGESRLEAGPTQTQGGRQVGRGEHGPGRQHGGVGRGLATPHLIAGRDSHGRVVEQAAGGEGGGVVVVLVQEGVHSQQDVVVAAVQRRLERLALHVREHSAQQLHRGTSTAPPRVHRGRL